MVPITDLAETAGAQRRKRTGRVQATSATAAPGIHSRQRPDPLPARPLLTTGEAARALSISVQTVRNWVARGRLEAVTRGVRTMLPRDIVIAEIERSRIHPKRSAPSEAELLAKAVNPSSIPTVRALPRRERIFGWMDLARAEGIHFPLGAYNARIPQPFIEEAMRLAATDAELPAPWSEHFRPATEDDVLALLSSAE